MTAPGATTDMGVTLPGATTGSGVAAPGATAGHGMPAGEGHKEGIKEKVSCPCVAWLARLRRHVGNNVSASGGSGACCCWRWMWQLAPAFNDFVCWIHCMYAEMHSKELAVSCSKGGWQHLGEVVCPCRRF